MWWYVLPFVEERVCSEGADTEGWSILQGGVQPGGLPNLGNVEKRCKHVGNFSCGAACSRRVRRRARPSFFTPPSLI